MSSKWEIPLDVAVIQPRFDLGKIDENLERAGSLVRETVSQGPLDIMVLPEAFTTGFPYGELPELALRSGEVLDKLSDLSVEVGSNLLFTIVVKENDRFYNRFHAMGPNGKIISTYDKTHLFSRGGEDTFFTEGSGLTSFEIGGARIAPMICYEVRFPELARRHIVDGTDILIYLAQWPAFRMIQWETLLKARAIENQCYVIGAGALGSHGDTEMGGGSMVIAPFGDVLCDLSNSAGSGRATIGPERMKSLRSRIPVLDERRPDLY